MAADRVLALVEAVLLLESEPIDAETIAHIVGLPRTVIMEALVRLQDVFGHEQHGIDIVEIGGGFLLSPKRETWEPLKARYGGRKERRLSPAALETLSIVAYSQPVTRAEVENIRGVKADGMVRLLLERNLIRQVGKKDVLGRPAVYGTTKEFLRVFGLKSIAHLPKLDELDSERFEEHG